MAAVILSLMSPFIAQLQDSLAQDQIEFVLQQLRQVFSFAQSDLNHDVLMLSGRHSKLRSDIRKGILDLSQQTLERNQLRYATLELVTALEKQPALLRTFQQAETELATAQQAKGQPPLRLAAEQSLFERMARIKEKQQGYPALWIDDRPANIQHEKAILTTLGLEITVATTSAEAAERLQGASYTLLLSDLSREGKPDEGLRFHQALIQAGRDLPLIFYTGEVDRSRGVPPYAFGIACEPEALLHLVMDVLVR